MEFESKMYWVGIFMGMLSTLGAILIFEVKWYFVIVAWVSALIISLILDFLYLRRKRTLKLRNR